MAIYLLQYFLLHLIRFDKHCMLAFANTPNPELKMPKGPLENLWGWRCSTPEKEVSLKLLANSKSNIRSLQNPNNFSCLTLAREA